MDQLILNSLSVNLEQRFSPFLTQLAPIEFSGCDQLLVLQGQFHLEHFDRELFKRFAIEQPASLANAVDKRLAEFLAGRLLAREGLSNFDLPNTNVAIGKDRNPLWPDEVVGSITHTQNTVLCALGNKSQWRCVGIDRENWLDGNLDELIPTLIQPDEQKYIASLDMPFAHALTITFSAKESLFKALYPNVGKYFDFVDAKIVSISLAENSFTLQLNSNLSEQFAFGAQFCGQFHVDAQGVTTLISKSV